MLPAEEMHAALLEAIGIANRWLRLCNQAGPGGASPIPLEALELRDEILQRSDAVIGELVQHRRNATSPLVKAAIACCQATVRQIQSLFESKLACCPWWNPIRRYVLNADLLRIPGLELNEQWLPEGRTGRQFERELLASLGTGRSTQLAAQSFDLPALKPDIMMRPAMLLQLDVWENAGEQEREALAGDP